MAERPQETLWKCDTGGLPQKKAADSQPPAWAALRKNEAADAQVTEALCLQALPCFHLTAIKRLQWIGENVPQLIYREPRSLSA